MAKLGSAAPHMQTLTGGMQIAVPVDTGLAVGDIRPELVAGLSMLNGMLTAELNYHFANFARSDDSMYLGAAVAYGLSNTTIDESISTGTSLVLPIIKLGYIKRVSASYALVFEGSVEAIAQSESFEDTEKQTTNIVNSKLSIGVRF
jgi:hypothetical protein